MNPGDIDKLCHKYQITTSELAACLLWFQTENRTFAFAETVAKNKKIKYLSQSATNFFSRDDIKHFVKLERASFWSGYNAGFDDDEQEETKSKKRNTGQEDNLVPLSLDFELTKENIKPVLERELSRTTDPEKRTALLIRVADFLSLNSSDEVDFDKPVIYLPDRVDITA